jgi:hypothetical protein
MEDSMTLPVDALASPRRTFRCAPVLARGLMLGIITVIIAESVGLHALVYSGWPVASIVLLTVNIYSIWWIWREGDAESRVTLTDSTLEVRHGRSVSADIPLASVRDVRVATWQDVPAAGTAGYRSLASGDDPNVRVVLEPNASLQLAMGLKRTVGVLGLRLESPAELVAAVQAGRI